MKICLFDPEMRQFIGQTYEEVFQGLISEEARQLGLVGEIDPLDYQAYMERCNARFVEMIELHRDKFEELDAVMLEPARTDSLDHYVHDMIVKGFFTCVIVMAEPPFAPALNITIEADESVNA